MACLKWAILVLLYLPILILRTRVIELALIKRKSEMRRATINLDNIDIFTFYSWCDWSTYQFTASGNSISHLQLAYSGFASVLLLASLQFETAVIINRPDCICNFQRCKTKTALTNPRKAKANFVLVLLGPATEHEWLCSHLKKWIHSLSSACWCHYRGLERDALYD